MGPACFQGKQRTILHSLANWSSLAGGKRHQLKWLHAAHPYSQTKRKTDETNRHWVILDPHPHLTFDGDTIQPVGWCDGFFVIDKCCVRSFVLCFFFGFANHTLKSQPILLVYLTIVCFRLCVLQLLGISYAMTPPNRAAKANAQDGWVLKWSKRLWRKMGNKKGVNCQHRIQRTVQLMRASAEHDPESMLK